MSFFQKNFKDIFKLKEKDEIPPNCQQCKIQFSKLKFKHPHQCKRCLKHICSDCGIYKDYIVAYEKDKEITKMDKILIETRKKTKTQALIDIKSPKKDDFLEDDS